MPQAAQAAKRITLKRGCKTRVVVIATSNLADLGLPLLVGKEVQVDGETWSVWNVEDTSIVARIAIARQPRSPDLIRAAADRVAGRHRLHEAKHDERLTDKRLTRADIERISGATGRQLQWWDESGIVKPRIESHRRLYTRENALKALVIHELRKREVHLRTVRGVLRLIGAKLFQQTDDELFLVLFERSPFLVEGAKAVLSQVTANRRRGGTLLVSITDLVNRVEAAFR